MVASQADARGLASLVREVPGAPRGGEQGGMQVAWTSMQSELGGCVFVTPARRSGPGATWKRTPAWLTPYGAGSGDVFKWDGLAS